MEYDISLWEKVVEEKRREKEAKRREVLAWAIEALKQYFADKKVKRVFLTGSILKENGFHDFSDIDVAVEGLEEDFFRTLVELEDILGRTVDLIEMEHCCFRREIEQRGLRLK
ncbi:nucleotidyltransferase family protein [Ammonifex thiophilus]|uniref:Polymerase beta nucleotidyltransferase domain-containing protein n=1 Tax=Ammonifex thiophilus TaxID=444093 RepID=A0A3D8P1B6_9THEO|nr:nucleotidyltransferase domain-containing protein [Ammonifex thiophilus]RDV81205.1 hypothetical protein DXX99_09715 [Ammonifex thiophilus]